MKILAILAILVLLIAARPVNVSQYGFPWRGTLPVKITIADHTSPDWRPYILQAAADWSQSTVLDVVVLPSDNKCSSKEKLSICNGYVGLGSTGNAWTIYDSRNGYMTNADTTYNQSYVDGYEFPPGTFHPAYTPDQRAHMVCHEMGNALGLLNDKSCTYYDPFGGSAWQAHPTQTDYDQLVVVYTQ